jgi:hypothetical protein
MAKLSITRRLMVSVILAQVVLTLAMVALATYLTEQQLRDSFDAALHGRVMSVAALVRYSEDDSPKLFLIPGLCRLRWIASIPIFIRSWARTAA